MIFLPQMETLLSGSSDMDINAITYLEQTKKTRK